MRLQLWFLLISNKVTENPWLSCFQTALICRRLVNLVCLKFAFLIFSFVSPPSIWKRVLSMRVHIHPVCLLLSSYKDSFLVTDTAYVKSFDWLLVKDNVHFWTCYQNQSWKWFVTFSITCTNENVSRSLQTICELNIENSNSRYSTVKCTDEWCWGSGYQSAREIACTHNKIQRYFLIVRVITNCSRRSAYLAYLAAATASA